MYTPQIYQVPFFDAPQRFVSIVGGVRSGKTHSAVRKFYKRICEDYYAHYFNGFKDAFMHYWVITPDFPIGKVVIRDLFAAIHEVDPQHVKKWRASYKELWLYPNILIEFKSANNPSGLVSVKLNGALIDEAARLHPDAWMGGIRARLTDKAGWAVFDTSPTGKNWYYNEIYLRGDKNSPCHDKSYINFVVKTAQNIYIPSGEIDEARRQLPIKWFKRDYEASFDEFQGQVYEEFNRSVHIYPRSGVPVPGMFARYIAGIDWGYSTPGCIMVFGKTDSTPASYYELETLYDTKTPVVSVNEQDTWIKRAKKLAEKYPGLIFRPGKDKPEYTQELINNNLNVEDTDYSVEAGIQTIATLHHVDTFSGLPRIFYRYNAPRVVFDERESYCWAVNRVGNTKADPIKEFDHSIDAERYALHAEEKKVMPFSGQINQGDPDWYKPETYLDYGYGRML